MNWWQRRLAEQAAGAPAAPPPNNYPPQPQYGSPPQFGSSPPSMHDQPVATNGQIQSMDAVFRFRGSRAAQQEQATCPECGGSNYFSMRNTEGVMTVRGQVTPKPRCYDCGYPLLQSGSMGVGAPSDGKPIRPARQAAYNDLGDVGFHPDVVVAHVK